EVAKVLDDWHDAAAKADEPRYFAHFAETGVFLGTDATERWPVAAFRVYAHPHFSSGKAWTRKPSERHVDLSLGLRVHALPEEKWGWTLKPSERHVDLSPDGSTAWFDEKVDS